LKHEAFDKWLGDISIKPEMGSLYMPVTDDIFKTNEGDREAEIKKIQAVLDKNRMQID